ncbi:hypothetical protein [Novosphingobium sp. ST904]|uniref:hypothetical protein n=1 Tax=Novosphingobium sp. ST904 TaxID=1684385 RepID=UPI0006C8A31B|nr:hypothetical protein [Novosphingobium sp. ST904]KPH57612.1 hypothetical protein ADT71_29300 [Novosphingobium sp. ST904]TCM43222.1 hypothetical protein EDF59_101325 [Novosphingobium sp. ST904]
MLAVAALGAACLALSPAGSAVADSGAPVASHCVPGERVLYSCAFPRGVGSLCSDGETVHYRYGPRGKAEIDLAGLPDWSNVRVGDVRGQGNGYERHVRISRGRFHYVVFEGMNGELSESPGRAYSGIAVLEGARGERELITLSCPGRSAHDLSAPLLQERAEAEEPNGPFDMWY